MKIHQIVIHLTTEEYDKHKEAKGVRTWKEYFDRWYLRNQEAAMEAAGDNLQVIAS